MTDVTQTTREKTAIDRIADEHLATEVVLSPLTATFIGLPGDETQLDDVSPEGLEEQASLVRGTLAKLAEAEPVDDVDRVTLEAMQERLGLELEMHEALIPHASLNNIASPLQSFRDVFDLMATDTAEQWQTIAQRLGAVEGALDGWFASLAYATERGRVPAARQVRACIGQCEDNSADGGFFDTFAAGARLADGGELPTEVQELLTTNAAAAKAAYAAAGKRLTEEVLPTARAEDACGIEDYRLHSRYFLGAEIDLEETYRWGQEELARIDGLMLETAQQIKPGSTVKEAVEVLDADPAYQLHGKDALREWMQGKADEVIEKLGGTHFDVPEPVRTIECMIAPTETGGIYYTGPSDDFSRPGRMWWSVPKGVTQFSAWRELTTVYHEGVPGHHLQVAQTVYRKELLNDWRRLAAWTSGHGEGWALYSEWLMADLGWMNDPGNRMGLLDGQVLRAARVVLDIGFHCGFEAPAEVGGGAWDYDKAWTFLTNHVNTEEGFLRFELDRYLGWPGQAPSYKIGERLWLELRDECRARAEARGEEFDLKAFHRRALDLGGMGLDTLREAVLRGA
ncbi:Uncharacterized conserved protein, DUF885 familyt [Kytococcus aerolatus]|uniref:Uncharacterized conserved protein, DUF885 familyt n=1 Tax=Kytococcus aerolatus TaxID=592308 RepID=A0A212TZW0_9MICO|nr:DUF885 domain-containing protein [Kytococcus aerolatus]SNC71416.1 Uncharacterized conserved protein, DUF885 familyt [Kytococcus aerolatus]